MSIKDAGDRERDVRVSSELLELPAPRIQLIGQPMLLVQGGRRIKLAAREAAIVLLVAVERDCMAAHLARMTWPDKSPEKADRNFRATRWRLKDEAGCAVIEGGAGEPLRLSLPCDLTTAERCLAEDPTALEGNLLGSLRFDELGELADRVELHRRAWLVDRRRLLRRLALEREAADRLGDAHVYRKRLLDEDPDDEALLRDLLRVQYLLGEGELVARTYQEFCDRRIAGFGLQPTEETRRLAEGLTARAAATAPQAATVPLFIRRPPVLIGRERHLKELAAARETNESVLLVGDGGVGKSRLIEEFANSSVMVYIGKPRPSERAIPFGAMANVVRAALAALPDHSDLSESIRAELARFVPELGRPVRETLDLEVLRDAMGCLLHSSGLTCITIDDLQYLDAESLTLLDRFVGRRDGPWWLLAGRGAELPAQAAAWLGASDGPRTIAVDGLSKSDARALVATLGLERLDVEEWGPRLHGHTGGNPLLLLETLRAQWLSGTWSGPKLPRTDRVGSLLESTARRLKPHARRLAAWLALSGGRYDSAVASQVLSRADADVVSDWAELAAEGIVRGLGFTHDLYRDTVLALTPEPEAAALHAAIARHIPESADAPAAHVAASHLVQAHLHAQAGSRYKDMALAFRAQRRHDDESRCWQSALECFRAADPDGDALLEAEAESIYPMIVTHGVAPALARAQSLTPRLRSERTRLIAARAHARALMLAGRFDDAGPVLDRFLDLATRLGDEAARLEARVAATFRMAVVGHAGEAIELLRDLERSAPTGSDPAVRYDCVAAQSFVLRQLGRHAECVLTQDRQIALAEELGDPEEVVIARSSRALSLIDLGRHIDAAAQGQQAVQDAAGRGGKGSVSVALAHVFLAMAELSVGLHDRARRSLEVARNGFEVAGALHHLPDLTGYQALLEMQLGRWNEARTLLEGDWQAAPAQARARREVALATMARREGRSTLEHLAAAASLCEGMRWAKARALSLVALERSYAVRPDEACRDLEAHLRQLEPLDERSVAMSLRCRLAECQLETNPQAALLTACACWREVSECSPVLGPLRLWAACARVFSACSQRALLRSVLSNFQRWLRDVALPGTDASMHRDLLRGNPMVALLLELKAADRRAAEAAAITPK